MSSRHLVVNIEQRLCVAIQSHHDIPSMSIPESESAGERRKSRRSLWVENVARAVEMVPQGSVVLAIDADVNIREFFQTHTALRDALKGAGTTASAVELLEAAIVYETLMVKTMDILLRAIDRGRGSERALISYQNIKSSAEFCPYTHRVHTMANGVDHAWWDGP